MGGAPLLSVLSVGLRYGAVDALRDVSFSADSGTVTCLLGDNGAGKSSLIKILSGVHPPTSGSLNMQGERLSFRSPAAARERGIATVFQDLALVPLLSVWRNFHLGAEPTRGSGLLRRLDQLSELGLQIDVDRPVAALSGGERQAVAIARAIHFGARVLILDEPTAALAVRAASIVLHQVARARDRGLAVILVTHNPAHAHPLGDRYVVLRQGRVVADVGRGETGADALGRLIAGSA
jgi:simple sugar transport system ATP-binding protein